MKSKPEIHEFMREHGANPEFWLDALKTSIYCSESSFKEKVQQNAHDKLKAFIEFIMEDVK